MVTVCYGAESLVDIWDDVVDEDLLETVAELRPVECGVVDEVEAGSAVAVVHYNYHGLAFSGSDQVVKDEIGVSLIGPAGLVLGHAVLQIENGIALGGVGLVLSARYGGDGRR